MKPFELAARYACDEKYETGECRPGLTAFQAWLAKTDPRQHGENLLEMNGAGPAGAAWNPSASLVVLAPAGTRTVRVGSAHLAPVAHLAECDAFFAPRQEWQRSARPLRKGELPDLQGTVRAALSIVEVEQLDPRGSGPRLFAFSTGE